MGADIGTARKKRAVRPLPAASLIYGARTGDGEYRFLMGRRNKNLSFMPDVFVFPGGRVEQQDRRLGEELDRRFGSEAVEPIKGLAPWLHAALRECAEETGVRPQLEAAQPPRFIARAITPARLPKRYDTHFFLLERGDDLSTMQPNRRDGELGDVGWYTLSELASLPLHHVTTTVMSHAIRVMADGHAGPPPLLVADRTPRGWEGQARIGSRQLKDAGV